MTRTVLTPEETMRLRKLYATGDYTQAQLAARFSVSESQVGRVLREERHAEPA